MRVTVDRKRVHVKRGKKYGVAWRMFKAIKKNGTRLEQGRNDEKKE